jgi:hypothetical protein
MLVLQDSLMYNTSMNRLLIPLIFVLSGCSSFNTDNSVDITHYTVIQCDGARCFEKNYRVRNPENPYKK